jgi:DNA-binding NtrC family response regulator
MLQVGHARAILCPTMGEKPTKNQSPGEGFNPDATVDGSARRPAPKQARTPDLYYLLVFHENSSRMVQLPVRGEVFLGRGADVHVFLDDASVSRRHAKLTLADGEALLEDLNSRNGTQVNGETIAGPRKLVAGDTITVCTVTLVYNSSAKPRQTRTITDLAQLRQRGEEEIERSLRYQRPLTVLSIACGGDVKNREALGKAIVNETRLMDVIAWGAVGELVVLMPETGAREAPDAAAALLHSAAALSGAPRLGFATCPEDGCEFETLLASARAAAESAAAGQVAAAGRAFGTLQIATKTIVVADPVMVRLYALVERLAGADLAVLIHGETGTGKEVVAAALHHWSTRRTRPLVTLNCAAFQETLLESELFGHEKGAFSGAVASKQGLLESAGGGTVLLDEIGELTATAQAKLLRVLETKRVIRLGDVREREIDIRIVAATNRNLQDEVRASRFRQDLFYRLSGATVWLPPLRSRKRELAILAQTFLRDACAAQERPPMMIAAAAMQALGTYSWPGNVRELKNLMEYVAAAVPDMTVQAWHLEPIGASTPSPPSAWGGDEAQVFGGTEGEPLTSEADAAANFRPIEDELREFERSRIIAALSATGGNQTRAARLIQMPLRTFAAKIKQYNIPRIGKRGT